MEGLGVRQKGDRVDESIPWAAACRAVLSRSACCSMTVGRRKWAVLERRTTVVSPWESCAGVGTEKVGGLGGLHVMNVM